MYALIVCNGSIIDYSYHRKFFDEADLEWLDLDEFGKVDIEEPFAQIPQNREVQYEQPKPSVPLEEEEGVQNVCAE